MIKYNIRYMVQLCAIYLFPLKFFTTVYISYKNTFFLVTFNFLNINQIRNGRVRNINKHRPTEMYLTQFLITSAGTTVFLGHSRGRDVCAF
jgi:hypothetical protein